MIRNLALALASALMLLSAAGCKSSPGGSVSAQTQHRGAIAQPFARGYFAGSPEGAYRILLIEDGLTDAFTPPGQPLQPLTASPVRHVIDLHVLWRPQRGSRSDHPAATNAAIDWYVFRGDTDRQPDFVHYKGSGFVAVYPKQNTALVEIRRADLAPVAVRGAMGDPLGQIRLDGMARVLRDPAVVHNERAAIEQATQPSAASAARAGE